MRHEIKGRVSATEVPALRSRLQAVLQRDPNARPDGTYDIHSIYFDTPTLRALMQKQVGMPARDKYRILIIMKTGNSFVWSARARSAHCVIK